MRKGMKVENGDSFLRVGKPIIDKVVKASGTSVVLPCEPLTDDVLITLDVNGTSVAHRELFKVENGSATVGDYTIAYASGQVTISTVSNNDNVSIVIEPVEVVVSDAFRATVKESAPSELPAIAESDKNKYLHTNASTGAVEWDDLSGNITEAVGDWLDDHPEATTTVEDGAITDAKLSASGIKTDYNAFAFGGEFVAAMTADRYAWYPLTAEKGTTLIVKTTDGSDYSNGAIWTYDRYAGTQLGTLYPLIDGDTAYFTVDTDDVTYLRTSADFTHAACKLYIGVDGVNAKQMISDLSTVYSSPENLKYKMGFAFGNINNAGEFVKAGSVFRRMATVNILHHDYDVVIAQMQNNVAAWLVTYTDAIGNGSHHVGFVNKTDDYVIHAGTYYRLLIYIEGDDSGNYNGNGINNTLFNSFSAYHRAGVEHIVRAGRMQDDYQLNDNVRSIAHRGLPRVAPENTLPAFTAARRAGFIYAETDVSWTADSVPVLLHDTTIDRTSNGTGNIADLDYDDIKDLDFGSWFSPAYAGTKIPTLTEFLVHCRKIGIHPVLELRTHTSAQLSDLIDTVIKTGMALHTEYIGGNKSDYDAIQARIPTARFGYVKSAQTVSQEDINDLTALKNGKNSVYITSSTINESIVNACANNGIELEFWTASTDAQAVALDPYVTGVTTEASVVGRALYKSVISQ